MKGLKRRIVIPICIFSFITISCTTPDIDEGEVNKLRPDVNRNVNVNVDPNAEIAEDNEIQLKNLISLPFEPEENVYREEPLVQKGNSKKVPGQTDRKLVAVLKFSDEDGQKLIEQLENKGNSFEGKIDSEPWFPAELIAKSQTSGDESIKGTGYAAGMFYKHPYNNGTIFRIDGTGYFVLVLQTR